MANETLKKRACSLKLANGTDSSGNTKYVSLSLGTLKAERWDGDAAIAVVAALSPCLSKTLSSIETQATYSLSAT